MIIQNLHVEYIFIWFFVSIFIGISSTVIFGFWLRSIKVPLPYRLINVPGFAEYYYLRWCHNTGRSGKIIITLRIFMYINLISAIICCGIIIL